MSPENSDESRAIRQRAQDFLRQLRRPDGASSLAPGGEPYYLATCYAVFALELLGQLESLSETERQATVTFLKTFQQADTGLFVDPRFREEEAPFHGGEYIRLQATMFCVDALAALGAQPSHPLVYMTRWHSSDAVRDWLVGLDWRNAWLQSNLALFVGFLLTWQVEQGMVQAQPGLGALLAWLDEDQDRTTGYWGPPHGATLFNGMAATFHHLPITMYHGHLPVAAAAMVGNTLAMQQWDGLFAPGGGGGACEDVDAIDVIAKGLLLCPKLLAEARPALLKARKALLRLQRRDGGFPYCLITPPCLFQALRALSGKASLRQWASRKKRWFTRPPALETEWRRITVPFNTSDAFSTWFRLLSLALVEDILWPEEARKLWRFKPRAGIGWHPEEGSL